jgi:hypothetical protein
MKFGAGVFRYQPARGANDWIIIELRNRPDEVPAHPQPPGIVTPTALAFGDQLIGVMGVRRIVTVVNRSARFPMRATAALNLTATPFQILQDDCTGRTIAPLGNCLVTVGFTPATPGPKEARLVISVPPGIDQTVPLSGRGWTMDPNLRFSLSVIEFGEQAIGTGGAPVEITITNIGLPGALQLALGTPGSVGAPAEFVIDSSTCPQVLAAGSKCTFRVAFRPSGTGTRTNVVVSNSDIGGLILRGRGIEGPGVVLYGKRETRLLIPPYCGIGTLDVPVKTILGPLFGYEFGSCLEKINGQGPGPILRDQLTLVPGGAKLFDDDAGVAFSLSSDLRITIEESLPRNRTMVKKQELTGSSDFGLPSEFLVASPAGVFETDLHVFTADGRRVGLNYGTGEYAVGIAGARQGGAGNPNEWISIPDDVSAFAVIDATRAMEAAKAKGMKKLDVEVSLTIVHFDANGVPTEVRQPFRFQLGLNQPKTTSVLIPALDLC